MVARIDPVAMQCTSMNHMEYQGGRPPGAPRHNDRRWMSLNIMAGAPTQWTLMKHHRVRCDHRDQCNDHRNQCV